MTSRYKVEQRSISHRGREFRFISYEGQAANEARGLPATDPTWFLVTDGHRWEAMPQQADQELDDLDQMLREWLEAHVFADVAASSVSELGE
jgi:hypothetical protein